MGNVIPMFALTGHPEKIEIEKKIKAFKSVGIDEVMAYPRSGCLVPYMSDEWFEVIRNTISACEENGVKLWLYDEFNWPSGGCGGKVQKTSPLFWSKKMIYEGGKISIVSDSRFPDLLNPDAVKTFVNLTHEQYALRFSDKFETVIRGVFTDEPCFNYVAERTDEIVYYSGMEADYLRETGRDLFEDTILYYEKNPVKGYVKTVYNLLSDRMANCYLGTLSKWCAGHGLELTGHLLADTSVESGTRDSGDSIRVLEKIHIPGIDDIVTRIGHGVLTAYAHIDAVKRATNKETMIELFALGPSDMSLNRKKRSLYLAAAFGVSRYFIAVAHLDAKGNYHKLRNYFNPECSIMPDYDKTKLFCEEAKIAEKYANKENEPDVYVRYPREKILEYWDYGRADAKKLDKTLDTLLNRLLDSQVSFAFLKDGDSADKVLFVDKDNVYDEKTGKVVENVKKWCDENVERKVFVTENGKLSERIFVKVYPDNTFIIADCIDTESKARDIEIHAFGKTYKHKLMPQEVVLKEDLRENETETEVKLNFEKSIEKGICRLYLWEEQTISVKDDVTLKFIVRNYPEKNRILLDGKEITADNPCESIGNGFNPLYNESVEIKIQKGEHKIKCEGEYPERLYLPICVLMGDFESKENCLYTPEKSGNTALFFGKATFKATVKIPKNVNLIRFLTSDLYTKLYVNGELLGEGAESRVQFLVPEKFKGEEVELLFEQISTIAPLFGTTESEYCIEKNQTPDWNISFGTVQKEHGILSVSFTE